ncbi:MAG: LysM peptidoglycan-binding domain-containing protein [Deltaproteobacteria bacterium]|nr:LysM peptidoglycan-binding domain-containing protein [Deltaproteobacteria bacterium]
MKIRNLIFHCQVFLSVAGVMSGLLVTPVSMAQGEDEETYSIDLVQTAEVAKEIVELDNKKILTETYTAKEGDHIWQLLRSRDLLKRNKLGGVLSALKKLNPSLTNIDMIHPGEKIVIPLVITPITDKERTDNIDELETVSLEDMGNLEYYMVKQGDTLIKVINKKYSIPGDELYSQYLSRLMKLNPDLKDPNRILPGQKIRLPIYSPKVVRGEIEDKTRKPEQEVKTLRLEAKELGKELNSVFTLIGEEWLQQGKHFIPLKTGGQIDLNTETYPIINLRNGDKVIVDLFGNLPDKMSELIRSNWDNYQIVQITERDDLKSAIAKTISACNYHRVYAEDESLVFEDGIKIEIKADWIIKLLPESSNNKENIICLNLIAENRGAIHSNLKRFLMGHGIKIIDYPQESLNNLNVPVGSGIVTIDEHRDVIVEKILELAGQEYTKRVDIPIYKGESSDFNLIIKADYLFKRNGKECIIDLNGLGSDIISLLKERKHPVLPILNETDAYALMANTLNFLGINFETRKHEFYALAGNQKENVKIILPGILFKDALGKSIFFTPLDLSPDIAGFLAMKVDNIFFLKQSLKAE